MEPVNYVGDRNTREMRLFHSFMLTSWQINEDQLGRMLDKKKKEKKSSWSLFFANELDYLARLWASHCFMERVRSFTVKFIIKESLKRPHKGSSLRKLHWIVRRGKKEKEGWKERERARCFRTVDGKPIFVRFQRAYLVSRSLFITRVPYQREWIPEESVIQLLMRSRRAHKYLILNHAGWQAVREFARAPLYRWIGS